MIDQKFISALKTELDREIAGGRIEKIQQPAKDLIILFVRKEKKNLKVLISSSPSRARVHITQREFENPQDAPIFCKLLRKHIASAVIESVNQPNTDRILEFELTCFDEIGRISQKKLVAELFGKIPDIILVGSDGIIIDCINRKKHNPGMYYRYPDNPAKTTTAGENVDNVDVSAFLDEYYAKTETEEIYRRKSKELRTSVNSARKRISKKLDLQRQELLNAQGREDIRKKADLLKSNLWKIKKGDTVAICEDYYQEGFPVVEIKLDPLLSPQQNTEQLYRKYTKLKKAEQYLTDLILKAEKQLDYIDSALDEIDRARSDAEIDSIREELEQTGFLRKSGKNKAGSKKQKKIPYASFVSPGGFEVAVGRNNLQNDELTFKIARKSDLWFHVKNEHGSHAVLFTEGKTVEIEDIMFAANLAGEYSKLKGEKGTPVDYCYIRNVKRQPNSYPGKVLYTDYKTIIL